MQEKATKHEKPGEAMRKYDAERFRLIKDRYERSIKQKHTTEVTNVTDH